MTTKGHLLRSPAAWAAAVALLAVAVHARSIGCGFVLLDDPYYVVENAAVQAGLTARSVAWALSLDGRQSYFHPLTWLSLMLDAEVFGPKAWAFHATNVLLHAIASVLLFLVLRRVARGWIAAAAAALFAVHPLTVEAVTWVTERKTVLSAALGLAAVLSYLRYAERRTAARYGGALAFHALSLLAKPGFVLAPALLLALDVWPLRRIGGPATAGEAAGRAWARILLEKVPFACASVAAVLLAIRSAASTTPHHVAGDQLGRRALTAIAAVPEYLRAVAWPANLAVFHPYPREPGGIAVAIGILVVLGVTAAALIALPRGRGALVGWAWFLLMLAPYLGLHQVGLWPYWADRFAYVPMMGVFLAAAAIAEGAVASRPRVAVPAGAVAAAVGVALATATFAQIAHWKDSLSLFRRAADVEPSSGPVQFRLGIALLAEGRIGEGRARLEDAIRLSPMNADAYFHLGRVARLEGRSRDAEQAFLAALRLDPRHAPALYSYALVLCDMRLDAAARPYFARFLELAPLEWATERADAASRLR